VVATLTAPSRYASLILRWHSNTNWWSLCTSCRWFRYRDRAVTATHQCTSSPRSSTYSHFGFDTLPCIVYGIPSGHVQHGAALQDTLRKGLDRRVDDLGLIEAKGNLEGRLLNMLYRMFSTRIQPRLWLRKSLWGRTSVRRVDAW
jgi:hypothetical protein